ncbi:MAG: hypothetical protein ABI435_08920 [Pseudolysinimonas sp.]
MDVTGYSYFIERRESDKRWLATVEEFPDLSATSKIHNRALNELRDVVAVEIRRRRAAGEAVPDSTRPPSATSTFFKDIGLT